MLEIRDLHVQFHGSDHEAVRGIDLQPPFAQMTYDEAMRRAAALRFWLLRLEARLLPRAGEVVTMKDPEHFRRMLERFRLAPEALPR